MYPSRFTHVSFKVVSWERSDFLNGPKGPKGPLAPRAPWARSEAIFLRCPKAPRAPWEALNFTRKPRCRKWWILTVVLQGRCSIICWQWSFKVGLQWSFFKVALQGRFAMSMHMLSLRTSLLQADLWVVLAYFTRNASTQKQKQRWPIAKAQVEGRCWRLEFIWSTSQERTGCISVAPIFVGIFVSSTSTEICKKGKEKQTYVNASSL